MWLKCSLCSKNCFFSLLPAIFFELPITQTPHNSNLFRFPLKVRVIGSQLYFSYLKDKDEDSIVKKAIKISIDPYYSGENSFYSNLMKMVDYYDLNSDFSWNSLNHSKVKRYVGLIKNKYVSNWNQTPQ